VSIKVHNNKYHHITFLIIITRIFSDNLTEGSVSRNYSLKDFCMWGAIFAIARTTSMVTPGWKFWALHSNVLSGRLYVIRLWMWTGSFFTAVWLSVDWSQWRSVIDSRVDGSDFICRLLLGGPLWISSLHLRSSASMWQAKSLYLIIFWHLSHFRGGFGSICSLLKSICNADTHRLSIPVAMITTSLHVIPNSSWHILIQRG